MIGKKITLTAKIGVSNINKDKVCLVYIKEVNGSFTKCHTWVKDCRRLKRCEYGKMIQFTAILVEYKSIVNKNGDIGKKVGLIQLRNLKHIGENCEL